jgi:hypothetical protein
MGFVVGGDLLKVQQVLEGVTLRRHADFEFLIRAFRQPIGEFKAGDIPLPLASKITVTGGKISDDFEDVENRTLARSVRAANHGE